MSTLSMQHILLSFLFTLAGTVGGWALTGKLAGDSAASSFFKFGLVTVLILSAAQLVFFLMGKKRLIYRIYFNVAYGCGLVWFMLCLLLPILWVNTIDMGAKVLLFLFLAAICVANGLKAGIQFGKKWKSQCEGVLSKNYNSKDNTIDWPNVLAPIRFSMELYIPGIPKRLNGFISAAIILSLLTGLSLRNVFPTFSLFAWGIPSCLVISMFVQLIGFGVAQIAMLATLEKRFDKTIRPNI